MMKKERKKKENISHSNINDFIFNNTKVKADFVWVTEKLDLTKK